MRTSQPLSRRQVVITAAVLLAVAVFYIASIPGVFILNPDSATYMGLGRSLARGDGYRVNGEPYGKYPPLFPLMLSVVYATAGESFWWLQLVPALCGIGGVAAVFLLLRPRTAWRPALALAVLTATCVYYESHALLVVRADVPYTFFALVALWLAERGLRSARLAWPWWALVGLATAAAIYVHLSGVALIPAVAGAALLARGRSQALRRRLVAAAVAGAIGAAAAGSWLWYGGRLSRGTSYAAHVALATGAESHGVLPKLALRIPEWACTPLSLTHYDVTLASGIALWALLLVPGYVQALVRRRSALEVYLPAYLVLSTVAGGPGGHERYVIPVVPLLLYYGYLSVKVDVAAAVAAWRGLRRARVPGALAPRLPALAAAAAGLLLFSFSVYSRAKTRRGLEKFDPSDLHRQERIVANWRRTADWIHAHLRPDVRIYPGSGGSWGRAAYFIRNPLIMPAVSDHKHWLLERLLSDRASYVLADAHPYSRDRLDHTLWQYRDRVFARVYQDHRLSVYRIDRRALQTLVKQLEAEGAFATSRAEVAAEVRRDRAWWR